MFKKTKMEKELKEQLKIAEEIAREAHKGQKRPISKEDYITHPEAVAKMFNEDEIEYKIVSWLHDVIEDSDFTFKDLIGKGISENLVLSAIYLTHKGEDYDDYINCLKGNEIARRVKINDLKHNLIDLKNGNMRDKYLLALYILEEGGN